MNFSLLTRQAPENDGRVTPTVMRCQLGRTIGTHIGGYHIGIIQLYCKRAKVERIAQSKLTNRFPVQEILLGCIQGWEQIVGIVATIDIVLAPLALCPGTTSHRIQTVLSENLLIV